MTDIIQGSQEWLAMRLGKVTASRVADVVARTKSGYGASRANYMAQLIAERLTGTAPDGFSNAAMQWGTDMEPQARAAYEFHTDADVVEIGFVDHPKILMSGASPDGLVGTDGLVEIKCPNTATHLETLLTGTVPTKYETQMFWQMACTGRMWCDFASYDPRLPPSMALFVKRLEWDGARINELETEVKGFLSELESKLATLRQKYEPEGKAA